MPLCGGLGQAVAWDRGHPPNCALRWLLVLSLVVALVGARARWRADPGAPTPELIAAILGQMTKVVA